jgi:FtsH-binding integral membrane protein
MDNITSNNNFDLRKNNYSIGTYDNIDLEIDIESNQAKTHLSQRLVDTGLFDYIKTVYFYTGIGWSVVLVSAELMSLTTNTNNINLLYWIYLMVGFVFAIFTMIFASGPTDTITLDNGTKKEIIPCMKIISYLLFSFSLGLMISPVIFIVNQQNKIIFPICIGITNAIFGIMSLYAWTRKNMDGIELYGSLMICVSGLIILGIIELILALIGFDKTVCILSFGTSIISIIVFSGLIFVDTLKAINSYNKSELNAIKCSVEIVLDLVNILLDLIQILSCLFSNSDD